MKFTLDKKILTGFVLCSVILLSVAVISFRNSAQLTTTSRWVNHTQEVLYEFDQILMSSVDAETGTRGFVITGKETYLEPFDNSKRSIATHLTLAKKLTTDNPRQQERLEKIRKLVDLRLAHLDKCIALRRSAGFEKAGALVATGVGKKIQDQIRVIVAEAKAEEQQLLEERKKTSEAYAQDFNYTFIALLIVIAIVLIVVYGIISTNLRALRKAEGVAANKNWSLTGNAELALVMQGNKQLVELAQSIINHLATYVNAQLGACYIAEEGNMNLRLISTYVADNRKREFASLRFGEGLAGQAAAEKKSIHLSGIPDNYFRVPTAFGEIKLKTVIALPFIFEHNVVGVIELGAIRDFNEFERDYLHLAMDSIAIGVVASQTREKTKELLEETQRQAEELEAQQHELRQANEELHSKTELLERSEFELKAQQEELQQANAELEEKANLLEEQKHRLSIAKEETEVKAQEVEITSKYKSEFLANMSHELRTPLNSILILAQLLAENKSKRLGEKESEFARNIYNSGSDLLNLINEILDLSKIEAGKMELEIMDVSMQGIVSNISSMFSEVAKSKSINFNIHLNDRVVPSVVKTDKQRVEQILRNLLSNAFKFTEKGGEVTLAIDKPDDTTIFRSKALYQARNVVAFSVTDSGIGISDDKQAIIFEAFQQADGSTKRKYGGTGLGLSISRELAHVLGGEIHLQSEKGKGSRFTLCLPLEFDASLVMPTEKKVALKENGHIRREEGKRIREELPVSTTSIADDRNNIKSNDRVVLIVEDEPLFANVLLDFVRERNYKGIIAHQGNTGLSYARHYKPDAILLDMKLPVMDGDKVLRQLKSDPELRHIPVQIISAYDQQREGYDLGAFDYIRKPVTTSDLQKAFERIEKFTSKKLKKLLIVEDNELQNSAILELVGNGDVKCYQAYLGSQAYQMLQKDAFDCIIVDLGLPDMTGFELLEKIKVNEALNKIPIIVYTGKDLKKEDTVRLDKLANTVVLKTANSQERLLDETMLFLHRVESNLPKEKQAMIRKLHKTDEALMNKKVLIVDDDIRNIYSLTNALEEAGVQCITAENGKVALQTLRENKSIDLVLMDIMMPEMDGYEATMEIRKNDDWLRLPIIALTAKAMKGDKEKCLAAGMSDYISKPVNIDQLLSLMRVWMYK